MNELVVTMTSWTKRIHMVPEAIRRFCKDCPTKIDYFYLWLSKTEFPDMESLPSELLDVVREHNVIIKFTEVNEYCHKRWHVYPNHWRDYVISIDDDIIYPKESIKAALDYVAAHSDTIVDFFNVGYANLFNHSIHKECIHYYDYNPSYIMNFTGSCVIGPECFPIETLYSDNQEFRLSYCNKCDECWLNPFLVHYGVKIANPMGVKAYVDNSGFADSMFNQMQSKEIDSKFMLRDIEQLIVLDGIPHLRNSWLNQFPGYMLNPGDEVEILKWMDKLDYTPKDAEFSWIPRYESPYKEQI